MANKPKGCPERCHTTDISVINAVAIGPAPMDALPAPLLSRVLRAAVEQIQRDVVFGVRHGEETEDGNGDDDGQRDLVQPVLRRLHGTHRDPSVSGSTGAGGTSCWCGPESNQKADLNTDDTSSDSAENETEPPGNYLPLPCFSCARAAAARFAALLGVCRAWRELLCCAESKGENDKNAAGCRGPVCRGSEASVAGGAGADEDAAVCGNERGGNWSDRNVLHYACPWRTLYQRLDSMWALAYNPTTPCFFPESDDKQKLPLPRPCRTWFRTVAAALQLGPPCDYPPCDYLAPQTWRDLWAEAAKGRPGSSLRKVDPHSLLVLPETGFDVLERVAPRGRGGGDTYTWACYVGAPHAGKSLAIVRAAGDAFPAAAGLEAHPGVAMGPHGSIADMGGSTLMMPYDPTGRFSEATFTAAHFDCSTVNRDMDRLRPLSYSTTPLGFVVVREDDPSGLHDALFFVPELRRQNPVMVVTLLLNTLEAPEQNAGAEGDYTRARSWPLGRVTRASAQAFALRAGADIFASASLASTSPINPMRHVYAVAASYYLMKPKDRRKLAAEFNPPAPSRGPGDKKCAVQ
jgi:hypothetical protein